MTNKLEQEDILKIIHDAPLIPHVSDSKFAFDLPKSYQLLVVPEKDEVQGRKGQGMSTKIAINTLVSITGGQTGTVKFIGPTDFASGIWIGVELDEKTGKNDGTINNKFYFECRKGRGLFVRQSQCRVISRKLSASSSPSSSPVVGRRSLAKENDQGEAKLSSPVKTAATISSPVKLSSTSSSPVKASAALSPPINASPTRTEKQSIKQSPIKEPPVKTEIIEPDDKIKSRLEAALKMVSSLTTQVKDLEQEASNIKLENEELKAKVLLLDGLKDDVGRLKLVVKEMKVEEEIYGFEKLDFEDLVKELRLEIDLLKGMEESSLSVSFLCFSFRSSSLSFYTSTIS